MYYIINWRSLYSKFSSIGLATLFHYRLDLCVVVYQAIHDAITVRQRLEYTCMALLLI